MTKSYKMKAQIYILMLMLVKSSSFLLLNYHKIQTKNPTCLRINAILSSNFEFNPNWITTNRITKIIKTTETPKLDFDEVKTQYNFNRQGYLSLKTSYYKGTQTTDHINKEHYSYLNKDSFLIRKSIYKPSEFMLAGQPNISKEKTKVFSTMGAKIFLDQDQNQHYFKFDKNERLTKVEKSNGDPSIEIEYIKRKKVIVSQHIDGHKKYAISRILLNKDNQIVKIWSENSNFTRKFHYDENGYLIKEEAFYKKKKLSNYLYKYIKN